MSKDLQNYRNNTQQNIQLRHLANIEKTNFLRGTRIESKHYNFIFDEGPFYGPIDESNADQINYLRKKNNNTSTLLINNLFDYYKDLFEKLNIKVSKDRIFSLDTNNIMEKIFICLENYPEFRLSFEKNRNIVLGSIFSNSNKIKLDCVDVNSEELINKRVDILTKKLQNQKKLKINDFLL